MTAYNPHELPEHMIRCMSPEVRRSLGIATIQEAQQAHDCRVEKDLLRLCQQELSRRGVLVVHHLSHRAREHAGYPDLTFALNGTPCACELKTARGIVSAAQEACHDAMMMDGWQVRVCRSFDEFREWLDGISQEQNNKQETK